MGGTDSNDWGPHSTNVFRFLAIPAGDGDVARIHGIAERVAVGDHVRSVGFSSRLLPGLDKLK